MKKIKKGIVGKLLRLFWVIEERVDNVRGELVSNYDWDNFFVRCLIRVVVAFEQIVINTKLWLYAIELRMDLKEHEADDAEFCKFFAEVDSLEDDEV